MTGDELETTGESSRPEVGGISPVSSFSVPLGTENWSGENPTHQKTAPGRSPATSGVATRKKATYPDFR